MKVEASDAGRVILSLASSEECEMRFSFKFASCHNTARASLHHRSSKTEDAGFGDQRFRRCASRRPDSLCPSTKGGSGFVPATPIVQLIGGTGPEQSGTQEPQ